MRKLIHPGQSIGLSLTAEERRLLTDDCAVIDDAYLDRINGVAKSEVPFTLDELEDLSGQVAFEANHTSKRRKQKALDKICGKIQRLLDTHTDDEKAARKEALDEAIMAGIDPKRFDPLQMLRAQIDALGLDVNAFAERLKPKIVRPDDKLPIRMSAAEKELVLGLSALDEPIRTEISQTPLTKRTVALTLRQVTALEDLVATVITACGDKKLACKWRKIDHNLTDVQTHYADGTEPEDAVREILAGKPVPTAVAARQMLLKLLEKKGP